MKFISFYRGFRRKRWLSSFCLISKTEFSLMKGIQGPEMDYCHPSLRDKRVIIIMKLMRRLGLFIIVPI